MRFRQLRKPQIKLGQTELEPGLRLLHDVAECLSYLSNLDMVEKVEYTGRQNSQSEVTSSEFNEPARTLCVAFTLQLRQLSAASRTAVLMPSVAGVRLSGCHVPLESC